MKEYIILFEKNYNFKIKVIDNGKVIVDYRIQANKDDLADIYRDITNNVYEFEMEFSLFEQLCENGGYFYDSDEKTSQNPEFRCIQPFYVLTNNESKSQGLWVVRDSVWQRIEENNKQALSDRVILLRNGVHSLRVSKRRLLESFVEV